MPVDSLTGAVIPGLQKPVDTSRIRALMERSARNIRQLVESEV